MASRRDFLAALGLGATTLGLPSSAMAWGRRSRRECTARYVDTGSCNCSPSDSYSSTSDQCNCACPYYMYTQANNVYYYYCTCCSGGTVNSASSEDYVAPFPTCTNPANCIGSACGRFGLERHLKPYLSGHDYDEYPFYLDSDATYSSGGMNIKHASAYIDGLANTLTSGDLAGYLNRNAGTFTTISGPYAVSYQDGPRMRYLGLYELKYTGVDPNPGLRIGQEVSDTPASASPEDWGKPFAKNFGHYHHVYYKRQGKTRRYHVAVGA